MRTFLTGALLVALLWGLMGCSMPLNPTFGAVYGNVAANKEIDTGAAVSPAGKYFTGEACTFGAIGVAAWGDASVRKALESAGVKGDNVKNLTVDHRWMNIMFFYYEYCSVVSGYVAE